MADALLSWISTRTLESEAIIGLCIIDAFELGAHFTFAETRSSVNAPSLLSDALLFNSFGNTEGLWPFRYQYAPDSRAALDARIRARFSAFNGVPQMFRSRLDHLEEESGAPYLDRWRHEWEWLQVANPRMEGDPSFFFQGDRDVTGSFDFADREIYVSAYLRTLAFAVGNWGLPEDYAVFHAGLAVTLNRGLADVACIERPTWTDDVILGERPPVDAARDLWDKAHEDLGADEAIGALRVAERMERAFVEYNFRLAVGPNIGFEASTEPLDLGWVLLPNADYSGSPKRPKSFGYMEQPTALCGMTMPLDVGRMLVDVIPHVQLPAPLSPGVRGEISTTSDSVVLSVSDEVTARWRYWYSDWDPMSPKAMDSLIGYRTTIKMAPLLTGVTVHGLATGVWCEVGWGVREYAYSDFVEEREGFWLSEPTDL